MIPMHGNVDSRPFQKNQMPFGPYQCPTMQNDSSYMMMDPAKSCTPLHDSGCNYWHHGYPMPSYSCCNGGNFLPSYYNFRPPHVPVPPHQHMHCYGGYPPYSEPYMTNRFHPYYNLEQPRYEFENNMMRNHHCCSCPNSLSGQNQKEHSCLKIEEEKSENQRPASLVPFQLENNQWPIVWFPPDYIESRKEREPVRQDKECHDLNSAEKLKTAEKTPKFWNGWPLFDMSRLGSWLPDAEQIRTQSGRTKQQEDGNKEFPFPFIWMPPFGRLESARKADQNMDSPTNYTEEPSNVGKLIPTNKLQKNDATNECPEVVKTVNQPQMEVNHKIEDTNKKKETRCIKVETVKDDSKKDVKGQSSTSPKKSKLPPVCLRVDPLPKKKNGNGSSRPQCSPKSTDVKESSQLDSKINTAISEPNSKKTIEPEPNNEKTIEPVEVRTHERLDGNQGDTENISRPEEQLSSPVLPQEKVFDKFCKEEKEEIASKEHKEKDQTISQASIEKDVDEGSKIRSRDLSDAEAALLIQSAYRGYEIRKWEPLRKMKQLAEVRQQIIEVQNRVRALEWAPQDEKEKVFVGEMIMRQLLKLDAIQGMHPSAREFRKSLATELVALQEKLDSIVSKPTGSNRIDHVDEVDEVDEVENESNSLLEESDGAQPLCRINDVVGAEGMMSFKDEELQKPTEDGNSELPEVNDENTRVYEAEKLIEVTEPEVRNEDAFELSSHDFSKPLEAASKDVELVTFLEQKVGKVPQTDKQEEIVNHQPNSLEVVSDAQVGVATPQVLEKIITSAPDLTGQIEDQLAEDMEPVMKVDNIPNNSEADKFEQIDKRGEVSNGTPNEKSAEGQEEVHVLNVASEQNEECSSDTKSENEIQVTSEELSVDQSNSNDDLNNEQHTADEVEKVLEDMQHQSMPTSELHNQTRRAYDESAELLEELFKPLIEYETKSAKDEQQSADEESKMEEGILPEECVVNPMPSSSKLENEANMFYAAEEATPDEPSPAFRPETMGKHRGSEKDIDKKLIEENEKMREMVEKLIETGKEQIAIISKLSGKVKDLEKRMAKKKKSRRGCGLPASKHLMLDGRTKA